MNETVGTALSALDTVKKLAADLDDAVHRAFVAAESFGATTLDEIPNARATLLDRIYSVERHAEALGMAIYELEEPESKAEGRSSPQSDTEE